MMIEMLIKRRQELLKLQKTKYDIETVVRLREVNLLIKRHYKIERMVAKELTEVIKDLTQNEHNIVA